MIADHVKVPSPIDIKKYRSVPLPIMPSNNPDFILVCAIYILFCLFYTNVGDDDPKLVQA